MKHYIQDALRTDGTWEQYADITFGNLNLQTMRLMHASIGIMNESIELEQAFSNQDEHNIREEIGDASWYWAIGWNAASDVWGDLPLVENRIIRLPVAEYVRALQYEANELLDEMKKHLFYGKKLDKEKITQHLNMCRFYLQNIAVNHGGEGHYEACLEINIRKLKKRYPDKFTGYNAINRDIIAEREVIENG